MIHKHTGNPDPNPLKGTRQVGSLRKASIQHKRWFINGLHLFICLFLSAVAVARAATSPREHASFDTRWKFRLGDLTEGQAPELEDEGWRTLELPHDWSIESDFSPTNASCTGYLPGGIGWYRKSFVTDPAWAGRKVFVTFDGVYRNARVWINGHPLGERPYGYSTFQHDLTPHLVERGENVLAVRVQRENVADSRWYPGSGIYRHVWITVTHPVHVPLWGTAITTPRGDDEKAHVVVRTQVTNETSRTQPVRVSWEIVGPDGERLLRRSPSEELGPGAGRTFSQWQELGEPSLWSPDSPVLYTMITRVWSGRELLDETRTPFGIRTFYFHPDQGFFLNGRNLVIKGLCLHHDGGVVGAAVPEDLLARRLRLVKELGGNAVRCAHNPMAPEFYELCDRLGLLVMDEAFDEWEIGKRKWVEGRNVGSAERFGYSEDFEEWAERDCADMVRRGRNHPSVVLWSIGNEIDYPTDPYVLEATRAVEGFAQDDRQPKQTRLAVVAPRLIAAVKRQDASRPVTMALANNVSSDATGLAQMLDVVGYNYQENDYDALHRAFPGRVIYGSENGRGYDQWAVVRDNAFIAAQFLWVGFDFLGEAGEWPNHGSRAGLFDTRGFKKLAAHHRQALWSDEPMVAVFAAPSSGEDARRRRRFRPEPHWTWPEGTAVATVLAFSNCERVELRLNGLPVHTQPVGEDRSVRFEVPYERGELAAVGFQDGAPVATNRLVTAGEPVALRVQVDRTSLSADGQGVAHAVVSVVDAEGRLVYPADAPVTVDVTGAGRLLGVDNGDQNDTTPLQSPTKRANEGRLLVLLQAARETGELEFIASAPGLQGVRITLPVLP